MWHVYILKCRDNSFYTGISTNIEERLKIHNISKGSKYTRSHRPVELLYTERYFDRNIALRRELEIKKFSAENKAKLVKYGFGQRFPSPHSL